MSEIKAVNLFGVPGEITDWLILFILFVGIHFLMSNINN